MDVNLEEISGFKVFSRLRERSYEPRLGMVFLSAFDNPGVVRVCKQRGALDYVSKDRALEEIVERVRTLLREHASGPSRFGAKLERSSGMDAAARPTLPAGGNPRAPRRALAEAAPGVVADMRRRSRTRGMAAMIQRLTRGGPRAEG
jgi:DNA-binding NarL/FixJ family response regulator